MPLPITIDPDFGALGLGGVILTTAVHLASQILKTDKYCRVLIDNISDFSKPTIEIVKATINSHSFEVTNIIIGEHMDAYAVIYRDDDHNKIYLNPLLLIQSKKLEVQNGDEISKRKYVLFLAMKIVHEVSHLVHPKISPSLCNQVRKRVLGGGGKRRMKTPQKPKAGIMFNDFGEMVEYDILGGILEIYNSDPQPAAFLIHELILYAHPYAVEGSIVTVKDTEYVVSPTLHDFVLQVGETIEKPYRGPRGHLGVSVSLLNAEADIISEGKSSLLNQHIEPYEAV